jgi:uncharacterized repeat protein (TIGR03803 family)
VKRINLENVRSGYVRCLLFALCFGLAVAAQGQTFANLFNFDGTNGSEPYYMSLVQGFDGNFYGTTYVGGTNSYGTVFVMTPGGTLTTLHSFAYSDGAFPMAGLLQASNGNLYGTTEYGGTSDYGTVFEITPAGKLTTILNFAFSNGAYSVAPLIQASNGNFYGTTQSGGSGDNCGGEQPGCGTVFEITPKGNLTTLYNFCSQSGCTDGYAPFGPLLQAINGDIYGTTWGGGTNNLGTVFKVTGTGEFSTVWNFDYGALPTAGLVQAKNGRFFGTTNNGGAGNNGTVFEMTASGALTTIYSFGSAGSTDGGSPFQLIAATDGNLYGTTYAGGSGYGTLYKITPAGKKTNLFTFDNTDGGNPSGGLFQATDGTFYGTTTFGGPDGDGTVFSLSTGLSAFEETLPAIGKVGAKVTLLGNNLTGASDVTFNGTTATFTVVSDTEITTAVPSGATSGTVTITTPSGNLDSNAAFVVRP